MRHGTSNRTINNNNNNTSYLRNSCLTLLFIYCCSSAVYIRSDGATIREALEGLGITKTNIPLPEPQLECTFNYANVKRELFSEYFTIHFLGYFGLGLISRQLWFGITVSLLFELIEQLCCCSYLQNFAECWWDSMLLDIVVCNFGGFVCGMKGATLLWGFDQSYRLIEREA
jgi:hypothetical protein